MRKKILDTVALVIYASCSVASSIMAFLIAYRLYLFVDKLPICKDAMKFAFEYGILCTVCAVFGVLFIVMAVSKCKREAKRIEGE